MAAFGIGATLTSIGLGSVQQKINPVLLTSVGALLITLALLPANRMDLGGLLLLWAIAGVGQTLVNVPTQTLIADRVAIEAQGRVYGAHFAWSHLWWGFSYPLAGWMVSRFPAQNFFYSSLIGLLAIVYLAFNLRNLYNLDSGLWHEHPHMHDEQHPHEHSARARIQDAHSHLHFHPVTRRKFSH
jgi:MFS transporter, NRE family, putaive nickel resistance protein